MKSFHKTLALMTSSAFIFAGEVMAAPPTADAEHSGGGGGGGLPQLDPTWFASQTFWLVLVFTAMYLIFARSILPSISTTLENRHEHIQNDLDTAERLKEDAETVQHKYESVLEEARSRASQLYRDVEDDIKAKSDKEQNELRDRLQKEMELSEARIVKSKKEAMQDMDTIVAEIASDAAKKIVGISTDLNSAKNVVRDLSSKASKKAA